MLTVVVQGSDIVDALASPVSCPRHIAKHISVLIFLIK